MNRPNVLVTLAAGCLLGLVQQPAAHSAPTLLYQSAYMSATQANQGLRVYDDQFVGRRFHLSSPAVIEAIGGHFFSGPETVFGAVVALTSRNDFPDSQTLSTPDVLAHVLLTPPHNSQDVIVPIGPIAVPPGDYLVLFGSGLFGATGEVAAAYPNPKIAGEPDETVLMNRSPRRGWWVLTDPRPVRLTVYGTVPEPSAFVLGGIALSVVAVRCLRFPNCARTLRNHH